MTETVGGLERGRAAFARRDWLDVHACLGAVADAGTLGPADLELLATAAYMLGRDEEFEGHLERAHRAYLDREDVLPAARCAIWTGISLALRGEVGPASGWFGRAGRLLEGTPDCVERGYLLLPVMLQQEASADFTAAFETATEAVHVAVRFGDADLLALAVHEQGRSRIGEGRIDEGLALLDEAMVSVTTGELSPIPTGIVYCSAIEGCRQAHELRRAREWTDALSRWCEEQPDLVSFTGKCLLHRAELMQTHGQWDEALEEAGRARDRLAAVGNAVAAAQCGYHEGEIHRLRGDLTTAEESYREASRGGYEPQPGLALLRLAQGETAAAAAAVRRVAGEAGAKRTGLVPAQVEILLAVGELDDARRACAALRAAAEGGETRLARALRLQAQGAVDLASEDAWAALVALREASDAFHELDVPYELARVRVLVALACRALGDHDTAALELDAARTVFAQLGAGPDVERVDRLSAQRAERDTHGLTRRELEVLRLVAAGETNRGIAARLVISEKTVARHVSNIFTKLRVSSRAAATAFAYENDLV